MKSYETVRAATASMKNGVSHDKNGQRYPLPVYPTHLPNLKAVFQENDIFRHHKAQIIRKSI